MKNSAVLLFFLLVSSVSLASCEGQISQDVPAVVGQGGGLVNVSISLLPGDGSIFVTAEPQTGVTTQQSVVTAVEYAYLRAGMERNCDVLVNFDTPPSTGYVEGPSAGTALSVMTYALLQNATMRQDAIITGSVDETGNVGAVGGLYEKARGAAQRGAKYFITPAEDLYETLLLKEVEQEYNITILQAKTVDQVIGFMLENRSIEQEGLSARKREIPAPPSYDTEGMENFAQVARSMVELENSTLQSIQDSGGDSAAIKDFFSNEVKRQSALLDKGYLFSAANEAFLNYIDLSTIRVILSGNPDLPRKKGEVGVCLTGIKRPPMTDKNFEWVIGSDLRSEWAEGKMKNANVTDELLAEEEYIEYNELMYGQAWCSVAKELASAAPAGGAPINESNWQGMANERLSEARAAAANDDTRAKLASAEEAYRKGHFGAAIYDAVYVTRMEESDLELLDGIDPEAEGEDLLKEDRASLWGRVYQSQGAFLYEEEDFKSAYRILQFAKEIDEVTAEMEGSMGQVSDEPSPVKEEGDVLLLAACTTLSILIFLFMGMVIVRWRSHGDNSPGPDTADRAKQEKGRVRVQESRARR